MHFEALKPEDDSGIREMSQMATEIVREHFDPIIGKEQNDYMIKMFQSEEAIRNQLLHGYRYFFVSNDTQRLGFLAFYPKADAMYLSKFYLYKSVRGQGLAREMLDFVIDKTREAGLQYIDLNVNRDNSAALAYEAMGFKVIREEKNDIGAGFYMDDFVYRLNVSR